MTVLPVIDGVGRTTWNVIEETVELSTPPTAKDAETGKLPPPFEKITLLELTIAAGI
jgi:hypothetical protein